MAIRFIFCVILILFVVLCQLVNAYISMCMSRNSVFILQPDLGPDKLLSNVNKVEKC